ncbi:hypothetical protein LX36DRAFT_435025 [Colletotrichum falcatum]|nr:hypothetical protein LX36DRAFT_435025 [Colletotrichum falcatum]
MAEVQRNYPHTHHPVSLDKKWALLFLHYTILPELTLLVYSSFQCPSPSLLCRIFPGMHLLCPWYFPSPSSSEQQRTRDSRSLVSTERICGYRSAEWGLGTDKGPSLLTPHHRRTPESSNHTYILLCARCTQGTHHGVPGDVPETSRPKHMTCRQADRKHRIHKHQASAHEK